MHRTSIGRPTRSPPCAHLDQEDLLACLPAYLDAAEQIAAVEVAGVVARADPVRMVEGVVTGTILGEALLNAVRRLAQQNAAARLLA
jgi:hypothetical protein